MIRATTSREGTFSFPMEAEQSEGRTYAFAAHEEHVAGAALVTEGSEPTLLRLEPARSVETVVLSAGEPVPHAEVVSRGWASVGEHRLPLEVRYRTGARGQARIRPLPHASILFATGSDRTSEPWFGEHSSVDGPVVLELHPTFEAEGRVLGATTDVDLSAARVVARRALDEALWNRPPPSWKRFASSTRVEGDGAWHLPAVPWTGPGDYLFRLEAPGSAVLEVAVPVERPSGRVAVEMEWLDGPEMVWRTVDAESGEPVAGVEVVTLWQEDGKLDWRRQESRSGPDGKAAAGVVRARKKLYVRTYREGYANQAFGPYYAHEDSEHTLELTRASVVHGRCSYAGEPVPSFSVTYWGDTTTDRSTASFTDAPDGRFEIVDAPAGKVHLIGTSDRHPPSAVVVVEPEPGRPAEVEIELPAGVPGSGLVLDGATGTPVSGAVLTVCTLHGTNPMDPWGEVAVTGADGRFEDLILSPHPCTIEVGATGYADLFLPGERPGQVAVDLGVISIFRKQDLVVQLVSETPRDLSGFGATIWRSGSPTLTSGPDGRFVFPDEKPGRPLLLLFSPSGARTDVHLRLVPGQEWFRKVSVETGRTVVVRLRAGSDGALPDPAWLAASFLEGSGGQARQLVPLKEKETVTVDGVAGDRLLLEVVDQLGTIHAARWVTVPEDEITEVDLLLTEGRDVDLLLLEPGGDPLSEAVVLVMAGGDDSQLESTYTSDAAGRVALAGVLEDELLVRVQPTPGSVATPQLVYVGEDAPTPVVVTVDTSCRLRARTVERGSPVGGVPLRVRERGRWLHFAQATSDEEGHVEVSSVSAGAYELQVEGGGYWPATFEVTAGLEGEPEVLDVRRMGSATLQFTRSGLPLVGVPVRVESQEFGGSMSEWIEEGLALAGEGGLTTDSRGEIHVQGIPNGPYRWSLNLAGLPIEGNVFQVPVQDTTVVTVDVP